MGIESDLQGIASGPWQTSIDDDEITHFYEGESGDGEPSWTVTLTPSGTSLRREIGWYVQIGDADGIDLVGLAKAMDAADRALSRSMSERRS